MRTRASEGHLPQMTTLLLLLLLSLKRRWLLLRC